jgi:hypothetical protein
MHGVAPLAADFVPGCLRLLWYQFSRAMEAALPAKRLACSGGEAGPRSLSPRQRLPCREAPRLLELCVRGTISAEI